MKTTKLLTKHLLCFVLLILFSCKSESSYSVCSFSLNGGKITSIDVPESASEQKIFISADAKWNVDSDEQWCEVSPKSGDAIATGKTKALTIKVSENTKEESRIATLTLSTNDMSVLLKVNQDGSQNDSHSWESAEMAVKNMKVGWNLGNTLDAHRSDANLSMSTSDFETYWGQPVTTKAMIDMFKQAGFNVIRVPVTWYEKMDSNDIVSEKWMNRVEEVVNYVLDNGMYCILNVHHDTGASNEVWLKADMNQYPTTSARFKKLWLQIANRFKKYDQHLIFEGYNEMLDINNKWTEPKEDASYQAVNKLAQDFVDAVRSTGGNNSNRNLCVNTYASAYSPRTLANFSMPTDKVKNHLMAQVHMYETYNFAQNEGDKSISIFTEEVENSIKKSMNSLNERFTKNGIPLVIGEFGAKDKNNEPERAKQAACIVSEAKKYGIVCIKWMGLSDRKTLTWSEPLIKDAIINSSK